MKRSLLIISLFFAACTINREFKFTKFGYYRIQVPKGYLNHLVISGNHGEEHQFWYSDSTLFYFSNETEITTHNYENISKKEETKSIRAKAILENDTFYLEGKDDKNLFWKEYFNGDITVGYMNVSNEKKEIFDKSINSLRKR